ncbi:MAG TPA: class I adenylate-forming enzyme family protein, partial [Mycobacteriales bacterium]|nr:class I adenylate-forming enzyme family protein [Mycobacteriales bacterium]
MSPLSYEFTQEDVLGIPMTVFAERHRSLRSLLEASIEFGDQDYLVDGARRITYAEHLAAVGPVAAWLAGQGVGKGDRVAIRGWNSIEWVVAFWATVSLGAIAVGLNAWWTEAEIQQAIADCEPTLVVDDMTPVAAQVDGPRVALPDVPIDEDDPAVILYTSGTSGRAKGAVHSHRNIVGLVQAQQHLINQRLPAGVVLPPARILNSTPLFHVAGLHNGVVAGMGVGSATIWQPGRFDAEQTLRLLESERCTSWSTMPTTLWRALHHPVAPHVDVSALQHIGGGGAAWSPALQRKIREVFGPQVTWGIGYGQTECTALATSASYAELQDNPTTVGRPVATVDVKVDGSGEILVHGPLVMLGYWHNEAATRAVVDDRRWLRTGDLGEIRDGLLYLSSRRTDLILRGAENVYPAEIENCLEEHPAVDEVAVVGLPDDEFGQHVAAVVVPAPGVPVDEAELAAFVKERLAYFKVPSRWFIREAPLPRTAT